jgi:hypothetical protein
MYPTKAVESPMRIFINCSMEFQSVKSTPLHAVRDICMQRPHILKRR